MDDKEIKKFNQKLLKQSLFFNLIISFMISIFIFIELEFYRFFQYSFYQKLSIKGLLFLIASVLLSLLPFIINIIVYLIIKKINSK